MTHRVLAAVVALTAAAFTCGQPPPAPDDCIDGATAGISTIEVGGSDEDTFRPYADNDTAPLVYGPQGGGMIGVRMRFSGNAVPACVSQSTTVVHTDHGEIASSSIPLHTYEDTAGGRTTRTHWLILTVEPVGEPIDVTITAGTVSVTRRLHLE